MADGLMGLKCNHCKKEYWFAKYYPLNFFFHKSIEGFDEFLNEHKECASEIDWQHGEDIFELIYDRYKDEENYKNNIDCKNKKIIFTVKESGHEETFEIDDLYWFEENSVNNNGNSGYGHEVISVRFEEIKSE